VYVNVQKIRPGAADHIVMNQDRFAGLRRQLTGKLRSCWGRLTGNPLTVAAGLSEQLTGRMRERYGVSQEAAARELKALLVRNRHRDLSRGALPGLRATRASKPYLVPR
jgi:uncharacterized protein YjbJ (UPF0337 family)